MGVSEGHDPSIYLHELSARLPVRDIEDVGNITTTPPSPRGLTGGGDRRTRSPSDPPSTRLRVPRPESSSVWLAFFP